jgi:hypothetical protein
MEKGKCFSGVDRGQRNKSDFYQTPYSITKKLLSNEYFDFYKYVLEPTAGNGAIVEILLKHFKVVYHNDIRYGNDFRELTSEVDYVITNPPFSLAFEMIQHCKKIVREKFALLLPLSYLHGQKRYEEIFNKVDNYPLRHLYIFTRYPMLSDSIREDGKYTTGMQVYAWFIWRKVSTPVKSCPTISWIGNNEDVLRKGE